MDAAEPDVLDRSTAGGKAIRGGVLRVAAFIVGMLLSLVSVPLMVRHLGVADYGHFVTVSAIIFIIAGISEAGLTNLGLREYAQRDGADREAFLGSLAGLRFVITAVGVTLATLFTWATGQDRVVVLGTLLAGIGTFIALVQQTYSIPLNAQLRLGWVSVLDLVKQGLLTASIVVLVVAGATLLPFFATSIVAGVGVLVVTLLLVRHTGSLRPRADLAVWRAILRDVLPYALAAAVGLIYFRLAVILMSYISSEYETGIYSTAFRIVEVAGVLPWLAVSAGFPILARAARDDAHRLRYALQRLFESSTLLGVAIALGIAVGAPFAIQVVAGDGFEDAVPVLRLLGVALVTSFLVATWSFALLSLRAHRELLICNAIAAVATAVGVVALEPLAGAEGAAIATVGGEGLLALSYALALRRRRPDLTPGLAVLPKIAVAAAIGGAAVLLPIHPLAAALVALGAYSGVALLLHAVPPEFLNAVRRREPDPQPPSG